MSRTGNAAFSNSIAAARCRMEITVSTSCLSASALSIAQLSIVSSVHDPVKFSLSFFCCRDFLFPAVDLSRSLDMALPRSALLPGSRLLPVSEYSETRTAEIGNVGPENPMFTWIESLECVCYVFIGPGDV
ncbi:hypothetical protein M431DRAFT_394888 [Trichoderma harzianum CBS 226.95]|uniref:Uncharacterized protein n=1 Tax=Trichoderma harzianum CBS 226.95 TaxID=983964 RepID=A0A2T4AJ62_TRIHA|nr:hypothetical protein M431DRAFT_394888 [Trichoderma harzianum CBS 226.95]PTB57125.1 hypothetical protein M431DRAFT_394888 [Trichoderma harzianum CBS 226.95]